MPSRLTTKVGRLGRRGEALRGVRPRALHSHLLGREQQHLDVGARERRARGERFRDPHQHGAGAAVVERARAARRQEGARRERGEGGDAVDGGGPGREAAEPRESPSAARSARGPERSQRPHQHQRDHRQREQVDGRALDVVERVGLGVVVRGEDQALLGPERGPARQHVILGLRADPAEDGDLPLELGEQQQRNRRRDGERRARAPGAHPSPVEQSPGERDHAGQAQRPGLRGEADQRNVETRALERVEQEAGRLVHRGGPVLARRLRELCEQEIPVGHRRTDGSRPRAP